MSRLSATHFLAIAAAILTWEGACDRQTSPSGEGASARRSPPSPHHATSNPGLLQPGDRWLDLHVETVDLQPEVVDSFGWSGRVLFSGSLRLSGRYRPHPAYPEVQELCFYPDPTSAARLPRLPNDVRTSWFCFQNQERAQAELAAPPATGAATIVIDRYDYLYQHTDTYNTARLREVMSRP